MWWGWGGVCTWDRNNLDVVCLPGIYPIEDWILLGIVDSACHPNYSFINDQRTKGKEVAWMDRWEVVGVGRGVISYETKFSLCLSESQTVINLCRKTQEKPHVNNFTHTHTHTYALVKSTCIHVGTYSEHLLNALMGN